MRRSFPCSSVGSRDDGTPVEKTYVMLMVADMTRALRFYTEAFAFSLLIPK